MVAVARSGGVMDTISSRPLAERGFQQVLPAESHFQQAAGGTGEQNRLSGGGEALNVRGTRERRWSNGEFSLGS
jgi:hypothetical protein